MNYRLLKLRIAGPGAQTGFSGHGHFRDQDLNESAPTLYGYPDNVPDATQWFESSLIKQVMPTRIFYDIFTCHRNGVHQ
ncbi:MAG TPA: hypothetical protein VF528_14360 [Pyrinomonadaceae bacterium]|jgi:hypothetical protein